VIEAAALVAVMVAGTDWEPHRPVHGPYRGIVAAASRIPDDWRPFADCVSDRESGGSYTARNATSSAAGRWQFLDTSWRVHGGIHYMVTARLRAHGLPAAAAGDVRAFLRDTPIHKWPGAYQDTAFVAVLRSGGWHHWKGAHCDRLAP
jgi:hypothetical protein